MAVFNQQSEDRLRLKRIKAEQAIALAMKSRWADAADVNRRILELFPNDVDSHNRLGKALMELAQYDESRASYEEALRLDPTNTIAAKNLQRLEKLIQEGQSAAPAPSKVDPSRFIEESGKTVVTALLDLASPDDVVRLAPGDPLVLELQGTTVRLVEPSSGLVVGRLEPKLNARVQRLLDMGNTYTAAVTSVDSTVVRVIIREASRSSQMGTRPSFPTTASAEAFRGYTREDIFRTDFEEDDDDDDELTEETETETEAPLDVELGAEEPLAEEPDLGEET